MKSLLIDEINGKINDDLFPYVEAPPSNASPILRKNKPSWASRKKEKTFGPRLIVFVLGGMSFNEMRSAYEVMNTFNREIIIGASCILSPYDFVNVIKFIHKGVEPTLEQIARTEVAKQVYNERGNSRDVRPSRSNSDQSIGSRGERRFEEGEQRLSASSRYLGSSVERLSNPGRSETANNSGHGDRPSNPDRYEQGRSSGRRPSERRDDLRSRSESNVSREGPEIGRREGSRRLEERMEQVDLKEKKGWFSRR